MYLCIHFEMRNTNRSSYYSRRITVHVRISTGRPVHMKVYIKCIVDALNMLKLNTDKTEVIVTPSKRQEQLVGDITISVGTSKIKPSNYDRNLRYIRHF